MITLFKKIIFISVVFFTFSVNVFSAEFTCSDYGSKNISENDYEKIIEICDEEIKREEEALSITQGKTSGVRYEIGQLDKKNRLSQSYINKKTALANRLQKNIGEVLAGIDNLKEEGVATKKILSSLIFQKNQIKNQSFFEALLSKRTISGFFDFLNISYIIENKIKEKVIILKKEEANLKELTFDLEKKHEIEIKLKEEKKVEKKKIEKNKKEKDRLLGILKKEEGGHKKIILNIEKIKRDILSKKFSVASGDKVTFGEAYNIINPYKKQLGMDPAFVLAILFQESGFQGKIGGNIGRCFYNQKNPNGNSKGGYFVMKKTQIPAFLEITTGLGINAKKQKISCPIPKDGAYGGAMGPAQFIPTTWLGIRNSTSKIIGKKADSLSPFLNRDAFVASASYLKIQYYSSACTKYHNTYKNVASERTLRERCSAAKYYAGGNWFKFRWTYGEPVVKRADRFRKDIKTLNS